MMLKLNKVVFFLLWLSFVHLVNAQSYQEVARQVNIDQAHYSTQLMGGGAAFFDFNQDGLLDLYLTGGIEPDKLYLNEGTGRFVDYTDKANLSQILADLETFGVIAGDINNDGCQDLFITVFSRSQANVLLLNNCDSTFTDISATAGITHTASSTSAAFIDYNKDGFLDIYVGNYIDELNFLFDDNGENIGFAHKCFADYFYINNGDNTFTEKAAELGVDNKGCTLAVMATDYDQDGDTDLYVANDFGEWVIPNQLYENAYPLDSFAATGSNTGLDIGLYGMGIGVTDYEEDGDFDYYITNLGKNYFMVNKGDGTFQDMADSLNIADTYAADGKYSTGWAAIFMDTDNSGDHDLFVANGYIPSAPFISNTLFDENAFFEYQNNSFVDMRSSSGLASDRMNRGASIGDFDNDGDLDLVVPSVATSYNPDSKIKTLFYENATDNSNNWLQVKLHGTTSNTDAYGSIIYLYAGSNMYIQELYSGGTHASQNAKILHFGLQNINSIDSVVVKWPSGLRQQFIDLPVNQRILLTEGSNSFDIMGCTDPQSENYNPLATYSTGCFINGIFGCTDPDALNYLPAANVDDGSCYYEVVTGLRDEAKESFDTYPNPFGDYLLINLSQSNDKIKTLSVVDLNGRLVIKKYNILTDSYRLNTVGLQRGVYLLEVTSVSGVIYRKKVIKE